MRQVLGPGALGRPRGIGWRGRWEGGSGWGIHVTPWLIHVNVWQNPLQYCKVISLQLIKINEKKKKTKKKKDVWVTLSIFLYNPITVTEHFSYWNIALAAAAAAKSLQSCPTLCDPIDGSPPGSAIPGILQARPLEWVVISFSNAWKWKMKVKLLSCVWLFATPWTAAYQAPPSMGFSRQEYWSGVPLPSLIALSEHNKS